MRFSAFSILSFITVAGPFSRVSATDISGNPIYEGCYSADSETISSTFDSLGGYTFQTVTYCERACAQSEYSVFALFNGYECFCGSAIPPSSDLVDASSCDTACSGYDMETCGGLNSLDLYAMNADVPNATVTATGATSVPATTSTGSSIVIDSGLLISSSGSATATAAAMTSASLHSSMSSVATPSSTTNTTTAGSPTSTGAAAVVHVQTSLVGAVVALISVRLL